jgi:hypothetical protein
MVASAAPNPDETEAAILARIFGNGDGPLTPLMARYILTLGLSTRDKARMHDLAVRNQSAALSSTEKEVLFAYAKAGTILSILKSKARRTLKLKTGKRRTS